MTHKIICLLSIFITGTAFSQNENSIYYDKNWEKTTKEKASFYRNIPAKKVGGLVLIEDFYINKTPQFQGYSLQTNENSYAGDIVWYDENGFDAAVYQYYNKTAVPVLTYYYPNGKKLKSIAYKNGRKDGFTILYHQDGTVLMKGKYAEGKPVEGDFAEVINWDDYRDNKSESESSEEQNQVMIESLPVMVVDDDGATKKQAIKKIIKKKTFWLNSKQLAQEIWYSVEEYQTRPVKQVNYDAKGKVLQTIEENDFEKYGKNLSTGTVYDYYFQNKFAAALKSETHYKQGRKSGEEVKYYPNGKVSQLTHYSDGEIAGDQLVYEKNEAIVKRTYQNNAPYEGNFDENFSGSLFVNQNYIKGIKEGEAVAKTNKNDSIVAKGIYENGRPYNGTFIVEAGNDLHELITVTDFKKNGLQKVFTYNIDNVLKTYNCLNDVVNGETIFYENGEITGKLEYKNGLPYEGKLVESETAAIYKKGILTEEIFYKSKYDRIDENNILKSKYFTNGKLSKIVDHSFAIAGNFQTSYEGIYKNDKPFSGYFATDFREFNYVDYYENGVKKYQYSNNYLENLDKYQHPNYDIKSTYQDGKIIDGVEYIKLERQFISKYWKNGVLQSFDFDVFAMHYFNRFHFELKNNTIEITELNKKQTGKIIQEKVNTTYTSKLIVDDKLKMSSSSIAIGTVVPEAAGSIYYSQSKNSIQAKILSYEVLQDEEYRPESEIFTKVFVSNVDSNKTIGENFNTMAANFSSGKDLDSLFENGEKSDDLAALRFNEAKKPEIGILILKSKDELFDLKSFLNGKVLEEKKNVDLKNIKKEAAILNVKLDKKFNESFK